MVRAVIWLNEERQEKLLSYAKNNSIDEQELVRGEKQTKNLYNEAIRHLIDHTSCPDTTRTAGTNTVTASPKKQVS